MAANEPKVSEPLQSRQNTEAQAGDDEDSNGRSNLDACSNFDEEGFGWDNLDDEIDSSLAAMEEAVATPLFEGSQQSRMGATYLLPNLSKLHILVEKTLRNTETYTEKGPNLGFWKWCS